MIAIDLEDWRKALNPTSTLMHRHESDVDETYLKQATKRVLEELDDLDIKATFFVLGEIALAAPKIIEDISRHGHEIASHSPMHVPPRMIPKERFASLVKRDFQLLSELTGKPPRGFRTPYFALRRDEGWVLDVVAKSGFIYDSSVVPSWTPIYGIPFAPKTPYYPNLSDISKPMNEGTILELPVTVWPSWKSLPGLPIGGGFFIRVWPNKLHIFVLKRMVRNKKLLNLYIHPGDLDSNKEEVKGLSLGDRIIQYSGKRRGAVNLRNILKEFKLGTFSDMFSVQLKLIEEKKRRQ